MAQFQSGDPRIPRYSKASFDCPHCGSYAQQGWTNLKRDEEETFLSNFVDMLRIRDVFSASTCLACNRTAVWRKGSALNSPQSPIVEAELIWPMPEQFERALPPETPAGVSQLWEEARRVAPVSARGAAALLRLALQVLLQEHVTPGETHLSTAIAEAFVSGVPEPVLQAMDFLRLTGNDAAHLAEVRLDEDGETLTAMFGLLRYVTEETVVRSARARSLYGSLPQSKRDEIDKRNQKALSRKKRTGSE